MRYFTHILITILASRLLHCAALGDKFVPIVLVHGGAGDIRDDGICEKFKGVKLAARAGYKALQETGSVLDAVEEAVRSMEADEQFNAGYGSVLTWDGEVEADASIMDGASLDAGCASIVKNILHPISVARCVMESSRHTYLAGEGVMRFADDQGFEILPDEALVTEASKEALEKYKNSTASRRLRAQQFGEPGTVGAVAMDAHGNVSAATSTGGLTGKLPGRIGDSPILGAGTYADNSRGAVSATGHGESIMRYNMASRIMHLMELKNLSAQEATKEAMDGMKEHFNHTGGAVSIDVHGKVGIYFTTKRMSWAYQRGDELHFGIDKDEDQFEIIGEPKI